MEEEFKWPSPLEMARNRWETLKEMLANPEDFDDIYFLAEVSGSCKDLCVRVCV
jgi:hypothetical protein